VAEAIQFYLDEHVPAAVANGLRLRSVDVVTVNEAGLRGAPDVEHLDFARRESRVVVTRDADFLRLHAHGVRHGGIVFAPQALSIGALIRGLMLIHDVLTRDDKADHVEFL
jgi:uncharacterized protein with PIN domain